VPEAAALVSVRTGSPPLDAQELVVELPPVTERVEGGHGLLAAQPMAGSPAPASVAVEIRNSRRLMKRGSLGFMGHYLPYKLD
jgi:hypothetical protein